jgi:folate-dependent phosphoribosylglycinamide formyltransferase PurN
MKWAALYSQSGSEICDISEQIGRYPDLVISDNVLGLPKTDSRISNSQKAIYGQYKPLTKSQKESYYDVLEGYDLITLHRWLNIVPKSVCEKYVIYNGHPGLINYYPELKGRDPQERTWDNIAIYMYVGSVIHKVIPEVDCGDIITFKKRMSINCTTLDDTYNELRKTSLESWVEFLKERL